MSDPITRLNAAPDDERFLMMRQVGLDDLPTSTVLVQHFFEELRQRVPN